MSQQFDLVVASHLRWNFVWQRPQQVLSRLARQHRILFVEEPIFSDKPQSMPSLQVVAPNIVVLAPQLGPRKEGAPIWDNSIEISGQVRMAMQALNYQKRGLWFYTPLPDYLIEAVEPDVLIYDVMDELANFKFAPANIKEMERRLLKRADVVFTGGASMYEAKKPYNENLHLFASGVDAHHYSKACKAETPVPDFIDQLPNPRCTYFGVIDERLDYDLLAAMAQARPDVQFVMVGPIVKVDPNELPKADNIHYFGQQAYENLPCILKGTDVCMMPFALNDATKFISPTKTLEYMATHRPIISTPIRDVVRFYSDICYVGDNHQQMVEQLNAALNETPEERAKRRKLEEVVLAANSWDSIASSMDLLMTAAYARNMARQPRKEQPVLVGNAQALKENLNTHINGTAAGGQ